MTLWVLCEHGEKDEHLVYVPTSKFPAPALPFATCPGGREATPEDLIEASEQQGVIESYHVFEVGATSIAVQHPLRCRANGKQLLDCVEGNAAIALDGPPAPPGHRYTATFADGEFSDWRILTPALDQEAPR